MLEAWGTGQLVGNLEVKSRGTSSIRVNDSCQWICLQSVDLDADMIIGASMLMCCTGQDLLCTCCDLIDMKENDDDAHETYFPFQVIFNF